jgi:large subunit ribosomal protein L3
MNQFFYFKIMKKFILGRKIGMTTIYNEDGAQNVTLVECGSKVSLIKNKEKDGYTAIQLEIDKTKNKKLKKEFRTEETKLEKDAFLDVSIFEIGDKVKVSGITKAKGFQGVVKRHGFKGSPKTHGHKHDLRAPGSIGSGFPEHVTKGKRMAGRMGGERSTSKNIKVVFIDKEKNILGIKGHVPGVSGRIVEIASIK